MAMATSKRRSHAPGRAWTNSAISLTWARPELFLRTPPADPTPRLLRSGSGPALDAYFAGQVTGAARRSDTLAGAEAAVRGLLWGALARALAATRDGFRSGTADRLARRMTSTAQPRTVTLTVHTHAAKSLVADDGTACLNTGTWLDQVLPPQHIDASDLPDWLARLQRDELPTLNGHPVAVVDGAGARLMRWGGSALDDWRDPTA